MLKKIYLCFTFLIITTLVHALDSKYAPMVNAALSDLKKHTKLSVLKGHVAVNISSGNKELDKQFAEAVKKAYPNFESKAESVHHEELYQMTIKVYRENEAVFIYTAVANFQQKNIVERTAKAKSVSAAVLETLQYKTAIHAKNEFEAYLNSTFANSGEVVQEAKLVPPPPPRPPIELPVWLKPDVQFETAWVNFPFSIIPSSFSLAPQAFIIEWPVTIFNFYVFGQMGIPFDKKTAATGRIAAGYLLRYNEYFHMPVDIGLSFGGYKGIEVGFTIGAGVMKLWEIARFLSIYTAVKINIGTDVKNPLNNTLMLSVGFLCDFDDLRIE